MRTPPPSAAPRPSQAGLTLIELLLALAIAALLLTVVLSLYHTVRIALPLHLQRGEQRTASAAAVARLTHDLTCAFAPAGDTQTVFQLSGAAPASSSSAPTQELAFCATLLPEAESDPHWYEVLHLRYRLTPEGELVRESRPLVGPAAATTNVLVRGVRRLAWRAFDGQQWQAQWTASQDARLPRALQLELDDGQQTWKTTVVIPTASPVASRLSRSSTAAP